MVEFVVRVPDITPRDRALFLAGDGALGNWSADGVRLERWDDGTYHARLDLPHGFDGWFLVTLGRWRDAESDGRGHELAPRVLTPPLPQAVEVDVRGWGRGSVHYHHDFASRFLPHPRTISVWLPPGYDLNPDRRHPVLYLQDGQNLFDQETAFGGNPWWADEVAERVIRAGEVRPLILVGVANTADRLREYGPRRAGRDREDDWSRDYARFLAEEVKPLVDSLYRTLPGPGTTGVGGSSMGGLIALHVSKWYPGVFGRCAALSPSLWWDHEYFLQTVGAAPDWMKTCRVWLDMGSREGSNEAGMAAMADRARRLAEVFGRRMLEGEQYHFEVVEGGEHNEAAWGGRFDRVLRFLYPRE